MRKVYSVKVYLQGFYLFLCTDPQYLFLLQDGCSTMTRITFIFQYSWQFWHLHWCDNYTSILGNTRTVHLMLTWLVSIWLPDNYGLNVNYECKIWIMGLNQDKQCPLSRLPWCLVANCSKSAPKSTSYRRLGTVGNRGDTMHGLCKDYSISVLYITTNFPMEDLRSGLNVSGSEGSYYIRMYYLYWQHWFFYLCW